MERTPTFLIGGTFRNTSAVKILLSASQKVLHWLTCLHFSVVMSSWRVTTFGMGLMGTRSTPEEESEQNNAIIHFSVLLFFFFRFFPPCGVMGGSLSQLQENFRREAGRTPGLGQAHCRTLSEHLELHCLAWGYLGSVLKDVLEPPLVPADLSNLPQYSKDRDWSYLHQQ